MKTFHGKYWGDYVHDKVCPRFEQFGHLFLTRILPAFDGIHEEATALEKRRYRELLSSVEVHDGEYWDAAEAISDLAFNEAMDYDVSLSSMQFATISLFAAALYHLTEHHLVDLCLKIVGRDDRIEVRKHEVDRWFKDILGLNLKTLPSGPLINELRLVANTLKHGEGQNAADGLRKLRPELFVHPSLRKKEISPGKQQLRMGIPLFGHDLFVTSDDFVRYQKGCVSFWTELGQELPKLTP